MSKLSSQQHSVVLDRRRAGILLHPSSLPNGGDLGEAAYQFMDFLAACRMTVWQFLPLGPTHSDGSPYSSLSVHAGNPNLISLDWLVKQGWLDKKFLHSQSRDDCLALASYQFQLSAASADKTLFDDFCASHDFWLRDYALYAVLRKQHNGKPWMEWQDDWRNREPVALEALERDSSVLIDQVKFEQYVFFRQWHEIKHYANARGILLFGDMPLFVAHDSADVWAKRQYFTVDEDGRSFKVAGVPPDYFSATGQLWGNPLYDWNALKADGFCWWVDRMRTQMELFDLIRIDHFRGLQACWEIPASAKTAMEGEWVEAPGDELLNTLLEISGKLPLVAEDLGLITPEVTQLRERHGLPGMKILQFAFDGSIDNPYHPQNHAENFVVYSGTHDNNTVLGWFDNLLPESQRYVIEQLGNPAADMPWPIIHATLASPALMAIVPMQDILGLGSEHRMNTPGTIKGNWRWRIDADSLQTISTGMIAHMVEEAGRV